MCVERKQQTLPTYQRAQVAYCHGLALEGLERPIEALNALGCTVEFKPDLTTDDIPAAVKEFDPKVMIVPKTRLCDKPNVLLVMVDQRSACWLEAAWSGVCPTPNIDRLRARGTTAPSE